MLKALWSNKDATPEPEPEALAPEESRYREWRARLDATREALQALRDRREAALDRIRHAGTEAVEASARGEAVELTTEARNAVTDVALLDALVEDLEARERAVEADYSRASPEPRRPASTFKEGSFGGRIVG